jgi:hypothetical protein
MKKNKKQEPPYVSDDFQIGPNGAFEWSEDDIDQIIEAVENPNPPDDELKKAVSEYIKQYKNKK